MSGNWKSKLLVSNAVLGFADDIIVVTIQACARQVASVVGLICAGIYPVVVVPLQIAYGGAERPVSADACATLTNEVAFTAVAPCCGQYFLCAR